MDNFLKWLIVGLTLLFFIYLMSGIKTDISSLSPVQQNVTSPPTTSVFNQSSGYVGSEDVVAAKTFWVRNFNTSKDVDNQIFSYYDTSVYNGLLFGKKYIVMTAHPDLNNYVSSSIDFTVSDTNRYGALKIMVNDFIVGEDVYDVGSYSIPIKKKWLANETKIIFYPESSSWRMWAPTLYNISGASFIVKRYYERPFVFKFNLTNDAKSVSRAQIKINLVAAKGNINVFFNGDLVYNGSPQTNSLSVNVPKDKVKIGENEVKFLSENNGEYEGSAFIDVDYITTAVRQVEKDMYFDGNDYDYLRYEPGRVSFQIVRTYSDGGYDLEIINSNGVVTKKFGKAEPGFYSYELPQGVVTIGNNRFIVKSVDGASFDVFGFDVEK